LEDIKRITPLAVLACAVAAKPSAGVSKNHLLAQAPKDFNVLFYVNVGRFDLHHGQWACAAYSTHLPILPAHLQRQSVHTLTARPDRLTVSS
jgi:hypothetical protein